MVKALGLRGHILVWWNVKEALIFRTELLELKPLKC